jgi:dipeptidyl aminopeptidase/acylaminoacyl peptidase
MTSKPENYTHIGSASAPSFSRDGGTLFHLRGSGLAQIWALDLASGESRQLTHHDEKVAMIRRAPQDDRIIYGIDAGGDERQQLWLLENGQSAPITEEPAAIHDFGGWSPDGTHITYAANDRDEAAFDVIIRPLGGEALQRLYEGQGQINVTGYSPDGRRVSLILDRSSLDQTMLLLDVVGGGHHEVPRQGQTRYQSVRWATDESGQLLCLTDAGGRAFMALCRLDPGAGTTTPIYEAAGRDVEAWALSSDRALLATVENDRGYAALCVGPLGGERPVVEGLPHGVVADLAWSVDGTKLAFAVSTPTLPSGLWLWEKATGKARPVWQPDPLKEAGIDPASFRDFSLVEWTSFDKARIPGWLARPAGKAPAGGWPAVIWVHGGPVGQTRANFRADMQMLLAQGYAVMMPNVRGSSGYGRPYIMADDQEKRLDSVHDLAHGREWLARQPDIDPSRIGVMGQSYGGYMVNAAITEYPEMWKAAINYYGIADFVTLLERTGPWRRDHRAHEYGFPDQHAALFDRISPIHHVGKVRAPVLYLHGNRDPRVPINESEQIVEALRLHQKRVRYEIFDYAGHGFIRPDHKRRVYSTVAEFFGEHL